MRLAIAIHSRAGLNKAHCQRCKIPTDLGKNSINNPIGKRMVPIFNKVLSINEKVMICVELPKFAVNDIKMLI